MSGIVGIWGAAPQGDGDSALHRMLQATSHEPAYVSASYANPTLGAWLGAVDNAPASTGLVWNARHDVGCLVVGEPFITPSHLARFGAEALADQPAAAILKLYEELGIEALSLLNGWFSGVIIELRQNQSLLFNDRYGLGRIYYREQGNQFLFASEAKSLLAVLPDSRSF